MVSEPLEDPCPEDHGAGRPVVLILGWPLSGRSWEAQVGPSVQADFRVVTYDRRGFGDSSQPWSGYDYDTLAADLDALLTSLDLTDVALVGFSMGGGEVVRYLANHGTALDSRAVLAAAVPPYLYRSDDNPDGGLDDATIEQFQAGVVTDRLAFLDGFTKDFFTPGGSSLLKSPAVSEPQRQYALQIAALPRPRARSTASPPSAAPTSGPTWPP
ncbi:alpha/beta fold hydrolase [Geodermatophilus normandii]|uniref:alpha/beta fold hydrolase n=1 Tax=Geodermatophilus normandii TaxID=1137989 RepID=UPI0031F2F6A0